MAGRSSPAQGDNEAMGWDPCSATGATGSCVTQMSRSNEGQSLGELFGSHLERRGGSYQYQKSQGTTQPRRYEKKTHRFAPQVEPL
jgi:hypothetical protein